ncbi:MAG: hypothetical protein IJJ71_14835 [Treponema sp.]|uniref:hypothetical protein n=1 Tax=Treponema sp. TaxID=166 RepID=UPI0025FD4F3A|nr:hypothetical protein [Treponema sp.]MBQ9621790.1 hypothetical protein [Treponema sp.]MBR0497431.1 hypothetical protein [Treponema sp.]
MSFWEKVCFELDYQGISRKELAYKTNLAVSIDELELLPKNKHQEAVEIIKRILEIAK